MPQFNENGELQPEKRLPPAFVGGPCIVICLFWFGYVASFSCRMGSEPNADDRWSSGHTHWIVPIIGSAFFSIGAFLLFNSVLNYLGDASVLPFPTTATADTDIHPDTPKSQPPSSQATISCDQLSAPVSLVSRPLPPRPRTLDPRRFQTNAEYSVCASNVHQTRRAMGFLTSRFPSSRFRTRK